MDGKEVKHAYFVVFKMLHWNYVVKYATVFIWPGSPCTIKFIVNSHHKGQIKWVPSEFMMHINIVNWDIIILTKPNPMHYAYML